MLKMKLEILDIKAIEPKLHKMDIELRMSENQMHDALAVLCEQMGDDAFIKAVINIFGVDDLRKQLRE